MQSRHYDIADDGVIVVPANQEERHGAIDRVPVQGAARMASQTRSGVTGISMCSTPSSASASTTALTTAPSAGVGQALWELCPYDVETGQLQATTFMDYVIPRADALPAFTTEISEVPSTTNALGLRGGGEGGTTPSLGAVVNAIVDALAELGVEHIEMPATPERVWRAIHARTERTTV